MRLVNLVVLASLAGADPSPALKELLPSEERVPDPSAKVEPGLRVALDKDDVPAAVTETHLTYFVKYLTAGDKVGVDRLLGDGGGVSRLPRGTEVLVLKNTRPEPAKPQIRSGLSGAQVGRQIQNAILSPPDKTDYPVEVRILSGPLKDKAMFVPESSVAPLKTLEPPRTFTHRFGGKKSARFETFLRPGVDPGSDDPSAKATAMLEAGKRFEKKGRLQEAVGAYWFTMLDYRELPQATEAASRLKAMGFSRVGARDYELDFAKRKK